jgi:hypothetical protein
VIPVKITRAQAIIVVAVILAAIILFSQSPFREPDTQENHFMETEITAPDPLKLGACIGETGETGRLASAMLPVTRTEKGDEQAIWRGFSNVTVIESSRERASLVLLDRDNRTIHYPVTWDSGEFSGTLHYLMDSRQVLVEGELFNYTAWNGERYQALRLTEVSPHSVSYDPAPLSPSQVEFSADAAYYHLNDTARLTVTNLSEDWLNVGSDIELYREVNGSLVEAQKYPDYYDVLDELIIFFPGASWAHPLPLYHLEPGDYTVVKEVYHSQGPKVEVETGFTVVEDWVSRANETHRFALRAMNCTLPEAPPRLPLPRVVHLPITGEAAEEIAVNVFGFEEPMELEEDRHTTVRSSGRSLEFRTRYDVFYRGDYGAFNVWDEARVVELAEALVSELEHYWVDETPLNYSVIRVGPSHRRDGSVLEVGVRYRLTLGGVPLVGPGADFGVGVSGYKVSGCEIHRPVLSVEGYEYVEISPVEAVQRMLKGESDTKALGFEILGMRPIGSEVTINNVSLAYFTDNPGGFSWLVPVYVIEGVFHVDPVEYGEETVGFEEYILATGFPYERTEPAASELAGLVVRLDTDKTMYELGETVYAEVELVNEGEAPVHVNVSRQITLKGAGGAAETSYPIHLASVEVEGNGSLSLGVYPFEPETGGLYVLGFSGAYTSVFVSDGDERPGFNFSARKPVLKTGEALVFDFGCAEPVNGSYVVVWDSRGERSWTSDPLDEWIMVEDEWLVPYYRQTADEEPMIVGGDDPLGLWGYTWYDSGGEKIMDGCFRVEWMIGQSAVTGLD